MTIETTQERVDNFLKELKELTTKWNVDLGVTLDNGVPKIQIFDTTPTEPQSAAKEEGAEV